MEQAIKRAIDGGWNPPEYFRGWTSQVQILLATSDPKFWQALGKVEGWSIYIAKDGELLPNNWLYYWHQLTYHLSEGKPVDEFFNNLLTNK